jgi:hypothetical protein
MSDKRVMLHTIDLRGHETSDGFNRFVGAIHGAQFLDHRVTLDVMYTEHGLPWQITAFAEPLQSVVPSIDSPLEGPDV